jgi:outer membrane usher protein FimD/PapC
MIACALGCRQFICVCPIAIFVSEPRRITGVKRQRVVGMCATALILAVVTLVQAGADAGSAFAGSWVADLQQSKLHPGFTFERVTLDISVSADTVTLTSDLVSPSGQKQRVTETFRTDGTPTPGTLNLGIVLIARWVGSHVLASVAEKGDQIVALVTYEVSADGKTLTSRSSGLIEQVLVFTRK